MVSIYALKCLANEFAYVGCTKGKLGKRMREHRCLLNKGSHSASALQQDWRRYGEGSFALVELERLPDGAAVEDRRAAELRWMDRFRQLGRLYNAHGNSFAPTPEAIRKGVAASRLLPRVQSPAANEARRLAQLGKPKGHGAKISATKRAKRG